MDEKDIKARVLNHLLSNGRMSRRSVVANEFAMAKSSVRADIAILSDKFIGVEVKSEKDSLKRLNSQIAAYKSYFDSVILVAASKHLKTLNLSDYPDVEILEVDRAGDIRVLSGTPSTNRVNETSLLGLLTQAEHRRFYDCSKQARDSGTSNSKQNIPNARQAFEEAFSERFTATSRLFWKQVGRRKIQTSDLESLSRFKEQRQAVSLWKDLQRQQWQDWINQLKEFPQLISEHA